MLLLGTEPMEIWVISLLWFFVNKNCCSLVCKLYKITFEPDDRTMRLSEKKWILSEDKFKPIFGLNFIPLISLGSVYAL